GYRAARITQLLAQTPGGLTVDDMKAIESDTRVLRAAAMVPALLALDPQPGTADGQQLLDRIRDWDQACDVDSYGCAAYMTVEVALQRAIFDDELGPLARDYVGTPFAWRALIETLQTPSSRWWDRTGPGQDPSHDPAALAGSAIDAAGADLKQAIGDPAS